MPTKAKLSASGKLAQYLNPPTAREKAALAQKAPPGRVFAYTRCSTGEQAQTGHGLDAQRHQLEGWAQMQGLAIDQVVVERSISGSLPFAKRPEGAKLLADLRREDVLAVTKFDRFSRNLFCLGVSEAFQKQGVVLAGQGLSPYKISADLASRGVKLSHVTVRKIVARDDA
jgi:hypothetical protein